MTHPTTDELFDHVTQPDARVREHAARCATCHHEIAMIQEVLRYQRTSAPPPLSPSQRAHLIDAALPPTRRRPRTRLIAVAAGVIVAVWSATAHRMTGEPSVPENAGIEATTRLGHSMRIDASGDARWRVVTATPDEKHVRVERGRVTFAVHDRQPQERVRVTTPHGTVHVTGTEFTIHAGSRTSLSVHEGHTRFETRAGESIAVSAGQTLTVGETDWRLTPASSVTHRPKPVGAADLYARAEDALQNDQSERAISELEALLARYPDAPEAANATFELARLYETNAQRHAAAAHYRRYLDFPGAPLAAQAQAGLCRVSPADC